jgi:hypothetical protein
VEQEMQKDLENAQTQIRNIEQELSKVELMQQNLARLQGVEAYLMAKLNPVEDVAEEVPEPAVDGKAAKGDE